MTDDQERAINAIADAIMEATTPGMVFALSTGYRSGFRDAAVFTDDEAETLLSLDEGLAEFVKEWGVPVPGDGPTEFDRVRAAAAILLNTLCWHDDNPAEWDCSCDDDVDDGLTSVFGCPRCRLERVGLVGPR